MSKIYAAALTLGLGVLAAAPAAAQQPPADEYALTVSLEATDGQVVHRETLKCDAMQWCETKAKEIALSGKTRLFFVRTRWAGPNAGPRIEYKSLFHVMPVPLLDQHGGGGHFAMRNGSKDEQVFYDSTDGHSWKGRPEFARGPIARLRLEIRY